MISGFELHMGVFGRFLIPASLGAPQAVLRQCPAPLGHELAPPRKARLRSHLFYLTARRARQSIKVNWRNRLCRKRLRAIDRPEPKGSFFTIRMRNKTPFHLHHNPVFGGQAID